MTELQTALRQGLATVVVAPMGLKPAKAMGAEVSSQAAADGRPRP